MSRGGDTNMHRKMKTDLKNIEFDSNYPLVSDLRKRAVRRIPEFAFDYLDAPIARINSKDVPLAYAPTLVEASLPSVKRTIEAVKSVLYV